jgi:hypothetical protein
MPAELFRGDEQIRGLRHSRSVSYDGLAEPANKGSNAMPPTDLNVPFHEKDEAKRLGDVPTRGLRPLSDA